MILELATKYPIGSRPKLSFLPHLILCSYVVSFIGAFTTVELLHRKIASAGWRSWVQTFGCAVSFALVAIWCMHFVGNRAIVLGDGESEIQLYYSPLFTSVSAVMPVIVIFLGLMTADKFYTPHERHWVRYSSLLVCAVCAGAAVTGLHYLGNEGTTNYKVVSSIYHVVGASMLAFVACLISFWLFFHWNKHWVDHIWRRVMVAFFLAMAVSAMHWIAAGGTYYEIRGYHSGSTEGRNVNLLIAIGLCMISCVICFLLGFLKQRERKMLDERAQKVVLAVVMFDSQGRLLVNQNGLMPCQPITQSFHRKTFYDDLDNSHPVFQWIFRVTRNWSSIQELIPTMREHLQSTGYLQTKTTSPQHGDETRKSVDETDADDSSYSKVFQELFCITAYEIAKTLNTSLQNLGCLYEDILTTGTMIPRTLWQSGSNNRASGSSSTTDLEANLVTSFLFGKGQMLFVTKKVDDKEAVRLSSLGYSFAKLEHVGDHVARSLQILRGDLDDVMVRLRCSCEREPFLPQSGTYLASFLVQPSPTRGFEVIVPRLTPDRLPMVKLSTGKLGIRQSNLLATFEGLSLHECLASITHRAQTTNGEDVFLEEFRSRIFDLIQECPEQMLRHTRFSTQQIGITHIVMSEERPKQATIFAFCGIKDVYNQTLPSHVLMTIPLSLFQTYLRSYPGCPDHAILAQQNHLDFRSIQQTRIVRKRPCYLQAARWSYASQGTKLSPNIGVKADSCFEQGLVRSLSDLHNPLSGIMVTSTSDVIHAKTVNNAEVEQHKLGYEVEVDVTREEQQQTMVDKLMQITTNFRDSHPGPMLQAH